VVSAGPGTVTARGTIFDVAIGDDHRVMVRLLRGAVDVDAPQANKSQIGSLVRLNPGEKILLQDGQSPERDKVSTGTAGDAEWPDGLREYTDIRLGDLIADANRYANVPIVAASSEIGDIRVSGTFRVTETQRLADSLANLLGLALITAPTSFTLAKGCPTGSQNNCRPPS
jgi:transmembrane sensor